MDEPKTATDSQDGAAESPSLGEKMGKAIAECWNARESLWVGLIVFMVGVVGQILLYTVLLFVVSLLPYLTRMSGPLYLVAAVLLGGVFLYYAINLYRGRDDGLPMRTFLYSIYYLMGLFTALLLDHYLLLW